MASPSSAVTPLAAHVRAAVLVAIVVTLVGGCGNRNAGPGRSASTQVPDDLVGQWQTAVSGAGGISDYLAEAHDIPGNLPDITEVQSSTLGVGYYFHKDGRYEHVWVLKMVYSISCVRMQTWEEKGQLSIEGSWMTLTPTSAEFTAGDLCVPSLNVKKPVTGERMRLRMAREEASGRPLLRLTYPSGNDVVYNRPGQSR